MSPQQTELLKRFQDAGMDRVIELDRDALRTVKELVRQGLVEEIRLFRVTTKGLNAKPKHSPAFRIVGWPESEDA